MILRSTSVNGSSRKKREESRPCTARPKREGVELRGNGQAALPFLFLLISRTPEDEPLDQRITSADQDEEGEVQGCGHSTRSSLVRLRDRNSHGNMQIPRMRGATSTL